MAYISLSQKEIDKVAKIGIEAEKETMGDEAVEGEMNFSDSELGRNGVTIDIDEIYLEKGEINLSLNLNVKGHEIGYIICEIPVDIDLAIDITQFYMKKLGKLKTLLEATKDVEDEGFGCDE